jgi:uncharacterized protein YndB with AHSA1/START domain
MPNTITVETTVTSPISKTWAYWNEPKHITGWAFASDDWEARTAENELSVGGKFSITMAAKDGSASFVMTGTYSEIIEQKLIAYTMPDPDGVNGKNRAVTVLFETVPNGTKITETFAPETINSAELQRAGWQAIIDNFKKYVTLNS